MQNNRSKKERKSKIALRLLDNDNFTSLLTSRTSEPIVPNHFECENHFQLIIDFLFLTDYYY